MTSFNTSRLVYVGCIYYNHFDNCRLKENSGHSLNQVELYCKIKLKNTSKKDNSISYFMFKFFNSLACFTIW